MRWSPWAVFAALPVGVVLIWEVWPPTPAWVEASFGRQLYPLLTRAIVPLSDALPFPVGVAGLLVLVTGLIWFAVRSWRRAGARGVPYRWRLVRAALSLLAVLVGVYAVFLLIWGASYRRPPLEDRLGLEAREVSESEYEALADRVMKTVTVQFLPPEERQIEPAEAALKASLEKFARTWNLGDTTLPRRAKRLPAGSLLTFGTSGMCFPFTLEAYVDGALPDVGYLAVALHELAHVAGLARESDADLAAFIAGLNSESRYVRYAIALRLLRSVAASLGSEAKQRLRASLPEGVRQDLRDIREAFERHDSPRLAAVQRQVYDTYLRTQGVEEGVRNYSRAVRLLADAVDSKLVLLEESP